MVLKIPCPLNTLKVFYISMETIYELKNFKLKGKYPICQHYIRLYGIYLKIQIYIYIKKS